MNTKVSKTICLIRTGWAYNALVGKHNDAVQKIHDINENRRQLRVQVDNLQEENARLKAARKKDAEEYSALSVTCDNGLKREKKLNKAVEDLMASQLDLQKKLEKSEKNDSPKDPKTGKFVSKKKAPAKKKAAKKSTKKKK